METPAKTVRFTAVIVSSIYAVILFAAGVRLQHDQKQVIAYLPTALGFLTVAFDKWLWKIPIVQRFLPRPRIEGIWRTTLKPTAESRIPPEGNRGPIEAYVIIEQSYWSIHVTQHTFESTSHSLTSALTRRANSGQQLFNYMFENRPQQEYSSRSPRFVGACELEIGSKVPSTITGHYFTERYTKGDMRLEFKSRETRFDDYQAAKAYCDPASS